VRERSGDGIRRRSLGFALVIVVGRAVRPRWDLAPICCSQRCPLPPRASSSASFLVASDWTTSGARAVALGHPNEG